MKHWLMASVALFWSSSVYAQQAPTEPLPAEPEPRNEAPAGTATEALSEDIVVTATKKGYGESVQNVPIAVTAFGEAQLDAKFVQNLQSLSYDVPKA